MITHCSYSFVENNTIVTLLAEIKIYSIKNDFVFFTFPRPLPKGDGVIRVKNSLLYNSNIYGIITTSTYRTADGKFDTLLSFRLKEYKARSAIPCFDERDILTPFQLALTHYNNFSSILSNTKIMETKPLGNGSYTVLFEESSRMHVSDLVFFLGNLTEYSPKSENNTNPSVSIWTYMTDTETVDFAYNVSRLALDWITEYTNVSYSLKKLDLIEFPDYFDGLLENWGLIFFKSTDLIIDDVKSPSYSSLESIVLNVVYKIIYQWFGNLVSSDDGHLWISNGISSILTLKFVNHTYSSWDYHAGFLNTIRDAAMEADSFSSAHPLVVQNYSSLTKFELIQVITKMKGASLIYNLLHTIGEDNFRVGLRNYLKKYSYSSATSEQLLYEFSLITNTDLLKYYKDWIYLPGYPVLEISKVEGKLIARQFRFLMRNYEDGALNGTNWRIGYEIKSDNINIGIRYTDKSTFELENFFADPWFLINTNAKGFYRVNFPMFNWRTLSTAIRNKDEKITDEDKIGLISDLFALAEAGSVDYLTVFGFLERVMPVENSYHVWKVIIKNLDRLDLLINNLHCHGYFRDFIRHQIKDKVSELSWTSTELSYNQQRLREALFAFATRVNYSPIAEPAFKIWDKYTKGEIVLDNSLLGILYMTVSSFGTHLEWRYMMNLYFNATNPNDKLRLLNALAWTKKPSLLRYLLGLSLDHTSIDPQFRMELMKILLKNINAQGMGVLWEFVKNNWELLKVNYTPTMSQLVEVFSNFATYSRLDEFKEFFKPFNTFSSIGYNASLEKIKHNIDWVMENGETICTVLTDISENEGN